MNSLHFIQSTPFTVPKPHRAATIAADTGFIHTKLIWISCFETCRVSAPGLVGLGIHEHSSCTHVLMQVKKSGQRLLGEDGLGSPPLKFWSGLIAISKFSLKQAVNDTKSQTE